jgi:hypothetical protein
MYSQLMTHPGEAPSNVSRIARGRALANPTAIRSAPSKYVFYEGGFWHNVAHRHFPLICRRWPLLLSEPGGSTQVSPTCVGVRPTRARSTRASICPASWSASMSDHTDVVVPDTTAPLMSSMVKYLTRLAGCLDRRGPSVGMYCTCEVFGFFSSLQVATTNDSGE